MVPKGECVMNKCRYIIVGIAFMAICYADAAAPARNLISYNPFLPAGWKKPGIKTTSRVKTQPVPVMELRGIIQINDVYQFSLLNKRNNKRFWAKLNDTIDGTKITKYDPATKTLSMVSNGRSIPPVTLKKASGKPLKIAAVNDAKKISEKVNKLTSKGPPAGIKGKSTPIARRRVIPRKQIEQNK